MTFPEWTKPAAYGAVIGAVAVSLLGFTWGGWTTSGDARDMADSFAEDSVTLAMVPVCLDLAKADADRSAKMTSIRNASSIQRRNAMMDTGWATLPGTEAPSRDLADACLEGLELNES